MVRRGKPEAGAGSDYVPEGAGLTVIEPDLDAFMEYSENYYLNDKDMVKDWDMDLYHQIKDLKY